MAAGWRTRSQSTSRGAVSGWKKTPSGGEIDFVVARNRQTVPVECKASLSLDGRSFRGIADYLAEYDQPLGVIVSFAAYAITEFTPPRSRRIRRVVTLPATLLERLDAKMGTGANFRGT